MTKFEKMKIAARAFVEGEVPGAIGSFTGTPRHMQLADLQRLAYEEFGAGTPYLVFDDVEHDPDTWDAQVLHVFERFREASPERGWADAWQHVVSEHGPRPTQQGRPKDWARDIEITAAVFALAKFFGVPPTRNEASTPESPCDAIAIALDWKYDRVVRIFSKHVPRP